MKKVLGIGAAEGIAVGTIFRLGNDLPSVPEGFVQDSSRELRRFSTAQKQAAEALSGLYAKTSEQAGTDAAMIFEIHQMMLEEPDYVSYIRRVITEQHRCAEYAVQAARDKFSSDFSRMDDGPMKERAADIVDVSNRLIRILQGVSLPDLSDLDEPVVVAAQELLPSQTIQMDKSKILAFVTEGGSEVSHASILARSLSIPAVAGLGEAFWQLTTGRRVLVDGFNGFVVADPEPELLRQADQKKLGYQGYLQRLKALRSLPSATRDGYKVTLCSNIGRPSDVDAALENGCEGVGLFRSEFLYMEGDRLPDEEKQFCAYRDILNRMGNRPVIVRTLDIGADKTVPYLNLKHEENPALGFRAIRICLRRPELFQVQLRALLRASVYGNLSIMFPMIISVEEVRAAKSLLEGCKKDLRAKGIPFAESVPVGIMIETPAAALISDLLAKEADFFSVGTNDLTQYTLAADRTNSEVAELYQASHPAVLRMILTAAKNARENGIWCGVCGESAADTSLTETLLAMGISELSVSPSSLLKVREKIRSIDLSDIRTPLLAKIEPARPAQ